MTGTAPQPSAAPTGPADRLALALATLGPIGLLPKAPGTWASLAAILAAPWCFLPLPLAGRLGVLALVLGLGAWAATRAGTILGDEDPGCVVIDELLGQWAALAPFHLDAWLDGEGAPAWELAALFALFRFFDILKPWPIRAVERGVRGGLGVMLDDLLAGLLAAACLALLRLAL